MFHIMLLTTFPSKNVAICKKRHSTIDVKRIIRSLAPFFYINYACIRTLLLKEPGSSFLNDCDEFGLATV